MPTQAIAATVDSLTIGQSQIAKNLVVFPLIKDTAASDDHLTLDEVIQRGLAEVTEVSEAGVVPELIFVNRASHDVLLLDSEELVGARQNRILNLTILVPKKSRVRIPVSCVERGRWSYRKRYSAPSGRTLHARGRQYKNAQVSESLARYRRASSDQQAVWAEIDRKSAAMDVHSDTAAFSDIYQARNEDIERLAGQLRCTERQVGAMYSINGEIVGLDIFESASMCQKQLPKLVRGYVLDAIEQSHGDRSAPEPAEAIEYLTRIKDMAATTYDAVGLGTDVRLKGRGIDGAALVVDGEVVHLAVFGAVS